MRFTNRNLSYVIWTSVLGTFAVLVLHGCSGPKPTRTESSISTPPPTIPVATMSLPVEPVVGPPVEVAQLPSPEDVKAAWKEGVRLFDGKQYAEAADTLALAIEGRQNDAYAHYLLGLAQQKSGRLELAAQSLETSAGLNGTRKTWINLARVQLERNDPTKALAASEQALTLDPSDADALHQSGRALAALGRKDEALEALRAAFAAQPGNGQIANTYGYWLIQSGREQDAVGPLEAARQQLPEVAYVRNNLGVAYERTGRKDEAIEEYRAAALHGDSGGRATASLARLGSPIDTSVASSSTVPETTPVAEVASNPDSH